MAMRKSNFSRRAINGADYIFYEYWLFNASIFYGFAYAPLIH